MCGFVAYIGLSGRNPPMERVDSALGLIQHRGPDDRGIYRRDNITLGHQRLSIIDLDAAAAQPMHTSDGAVSIVYNGEIYNFQELRKELINLGHRFRTQGDTEVILAAYRQYGIQCIDKFIGMFAFVLVDWSRAETFIVRDRLGIKPLYFFRDSSKFVVASEIKSILELVPRLGALKPATFSAYLSFRYPVLDDTFFEHINSVPPGHFLKLSGSRLEKHRYWCLSEKLESQLVDRGEEYYASRTLELLRSSVQYRQIADVKVGAYLSGGVDSSAVVALMAENATNPIETFSIGFSEEGYNEFGYARQVAQQYATSHHEILLSGDEYLETVGELIRYKDAPLGVPNEVPLFLMSKELSRHVKVVLSGEGADEIFGGYGRIFRSSFEFNRLQQLAAQDLLTADERSFLKEAEKKYGRTSFENEADHFLQLHSYTSDRLKGQLLTPACHNDAIHGRLKERVHECFSELPSRHYATRMMYAFELLHLPGLLQRLDTTTMANSVEGRVPFTDHRLVEHAFSIPLKYKLKWVSKSLQEDNLMLSEVLSEVHDQPKYILKRAMAGHLSGGILDRKKMGFPVPLDQWFGRHFKSHARDSLEQAEIRDYVNVENVLCLLERPDLVSNHALAMKIWMVMNIALFVSAVRSRSSWA